jgi:hypothetical protein
LAPAAKICKITPNLSTTLIVRAISYSCVISVPEASLSESISVGEYISFSTLLRLYRRTLSSRSHKKSFHLFYSFLIYKLVIVEFIKTTFMSGFCFKCIPMSYNMPFVKKVVPAIFLSFTTELFAIESSRHSSQNSFSRRSSYLKSIMTPPRK